MFCTNRILFGGRYSSGMTAPAPPVDFRPAPLTALAGLAAAGSETAPAGRLSFFCASCASRACFLSAKQVRQCCLGTSAKKYIPFSASLLLLCDSSSSSVPCNLTVASLRVRAKSSCIGLSNSSKPCTSSMARAADSALSKTMKAWPFALRFFLATTSMMLPYSLKISSSASFSCSILMRSSRLRT